MPRQNLALKGSDPVQIISAAKVTVFFLHMSYAAQIKIPIPSNLHFLSLILILT
jgi:hypothetical protein